MDYYNWIYCKILLVSNRKRRFLFYFFSTISYNLENHKWGSKFPVIMNQLYQGELKITSIPMTIKEL